MPIINVYNNDTGYIEKYNRRLLDAMPYIWGRTMTVGEFRANSLSNILWTDKRMMNSWNRFRYAWGKPIFIGYAFKRIWEGGHSSQSQHYAGLALDVGHTMTGIERNRLRNFAVESEEWTYVEPGYITPRWVHIDDRYGIPACRRGGYPTLSLGSRGVYVFILQDSLNTLGFIGSGLDGYFGYGTRGALLNYQSQQGFATTGIADCNTITVITSQVNGIAV